MLNKENFKDGIIIILLIGLFALAIMILKPVIISIFFGVLLAYIFSPLYQKILSKVKNENLSAAIVGIGLIILILGTLFFIFSTLISQAANLYLGFQNLDLTNLVRTITPEFLSPEIATVFASSINTFISNFLANSLTGFSDFILEIPIILLHLFMVIFIFFFSLRDGKKALGYVKSLSPLKKETQEKFSKQFKDITYSVLVGQIIVGIIQGLIAGLGYWIFGVNNALILTILTMLVGVIPLIGPWLVWVPVDIYLFASGHSGAGFGFLIYGLLIVSWLDAIIRPIIVSRRTQINSAIVIIGMIGGLFVFGILGLIIGPLVLAYVLLVIELYRKKALKEEENIIFKEIE
jgi:predicted PurR-regulated permease PerM